MNFKTEKEQTANYMKRLYDRQLTTCSGGNISMKVDDNTILITPSALDKGNLTDQDIALVTLDGENLTPELKISIETEMHLSIYRMRPDIKGIVHAHPLHATMYTASKNKLHTDIIAEARFLLGEPVMAPYKLMGTKALAAIVGDSFKDSKTKVVLMENHGVITIGDNLFQAYDRMEVLESAARMSYMGETLGGLKRLSEEKKIEIDQLS